VCIVQIQKQQQQNNRQFCFIVFCIIAIAIKLHS